MVFFKLEHLPKKYRAMVLHIANNMTGETNWEGDVINICYLKSGYKTLDGKDNLEFRTKVDLIDKLKEDVIKVN